MTKTKRTTSQILAGTPLTVSINGNPYAPKRLKLVQNQKLINEKHEQAQKYEVLRRKLTKLQKQYENGELEALKMTEEEALDYAADIQNSIFELATLISTDHNLWLLERFYPEAKESGDLDELEDDEYDAAIEAIFTVNPTLGKSKQILLLNPMNQNG